MNLSKVTKLMLTIGSISSITKPSSAFVIQKKAYPLTKYPFSKNQYFGQNSKEASQGMGLLKEVSSEQTDLINEENNKILTKVLSEPQTRYAYEASKAISESDITTLERLVLENKIDCNAGIENKPTFLAIAVSTNNMEMVKLLLDNGADPNQRKFHNPSESFTKNVLIQNIFGGNIERYENTAKYFRIHQGKDIGAKANHWNEPVINQVLLTTNMEMIDLFINKGVQFKKDPDDMYYSEPITLAISTGQDEIVKKIIKTGVMPKNPPQSLIGAVRVANPIIVKDLLDNGVSAIVFDERGRSPLDESISNGREDITRILLERHHIQTHHLKKVREILVKNKYSIKNKNQLHRINNLLETNTKILEKAEVLANLINSPLHILKELDVSRQIMADKDANIFETVKIEGKEKEQISPIKLAEERRIRKFDITETTLKGIKNTETLNKAFTKKYILSNPEETLIESSNLDDNKNSPTKILRHSTRFVGEPKDKQTISNLIEKLGEYQDNYLDEILTVNALTALGEENKLKIFAAGSKFNDVGPFGYSQDGRSVLYGYSNIGEGEVVFSNTQNPKSAQRILAHEMTHYDLGTIRNIDSNDEKEVGRVIDELGIAVEKFKDVFVSHDFDKMNIALSKLSPKLKPQKAKKVAMELRESVSSFGEEKETLKKNIINISEKMENDFNEQKFNEIIKELKLNFIIYKEKSRKDNESFLGKKYLDSSIGRITATSDFYTNKQLINEDILADWVSTREVINDIPQTREYIESTTRHLAEYWDKNITPKNLKFIINDPNLQKVELPESIKKKLIKEFPSKCFEYGIKHDTKSSRELM